jgi:hypothetical protein
VIFGYTLEEARKAVVAFVFLILSAFALFVVFPADIKDVSFTDAVIALTGSVFGTVGVFMDKNVTADDLSKAVTQLQGSALAVVGYFTVVPVGTVEKISLFAGAILSVYLVFRTPNAGRGAPGANPEIQGEGAGAVRLR